METRAPAEIDTLRSRLESGHFGERVAVDTTTAILDVLRYASAIGLTHGDLSPAQIQITQSGEVKLPKKLDSESDSTSSLESTSYLSPEQVEGKTTDARSDVFSVAAMFYEMLTGIQPFRGSTAQGVAYAISYFEPARQLEISGPVWTVLCKALSKNPDDRYSSFDEFMGELDRVSPPQPAAAPVVETAPRFSPTPEIPRFMHARTELDDRPARPPISLPLNAVSPMAKRAEVTPPVPPSYSWSNEAQRPPVDFGIPPPIVRKKSAMPAVAMLTVIGIFIFIAFVASEPDREYSDSHPTSTYDESSYVPPAPLKEALVEQASLEFSVQVPVYSHGEVLMPNAPAKYQRQVGGYAAEVSVATHSMATYESGSLLDAPVSSDPKVLMEYARRIAAVKAKTVGAPHPTLHQGKRGAAVAYTSHVGKQQLKGRVQVFVSSGRVLFFLVQWPKDLDKTYNPDKFFSSIKF